LIAHNLLTKKYELIEYAERRIPEIIVRNGLLHSLLQTKSPEDIQAENPTGKS
jgi:hypothetical protein